MRTASQISYPLLGQQGKKLLLLGLLLPTLVACSSGEKGDVEVIKHPAYQWDLDNNGAVTRGEYRQFRENLFVLADEDRDGSIDEGEWEDVQDDDGSGISRASFVALDFDGNGRLSFGEITSLPETDFLTLDHNGDGVVSSAELDNASTRRYRGGLRDRDADEGFRRNPDAGTY
ncbi:MAG: hypothetical protein RLN89_11300 [Parvibaculum sp.]